ncbi:MAG: nitroreductase family protein [Candidatus Acetothermia bacterium]
MEVEQAIVSRRSVRKFADERVEEDDLRELVNYGRLAPTGMNKQPLEFLIVEEPELERRVFEHTNWAGAVDWNPDFGERPRAYIFILINQEANPVTGDHDAGLAAGNICLGAVSKGLGSCLLGALEREPLVELLGLPEEVKIDLAVALGYPDQEFELEEGSDDPDYWLDEKGTVHVPKRPLDRVLHWNSWSD